MKLSYTTSQVEAVKTEYLNTHRNQIQKVLNTLQGEVLLPTVVGKLQIRLPFPTFEGTDNTQKECQFSLAFACIQMLTDEGTLELITRKEILHSDTMPVIRNQTYVVLPDRFIEKPNLLKGLAYEPNENTTSNIPFKFHANDEVLEKGFELNHLHSTSKETPRAFRRRMKEYREAINNIGTAYLPMKPDSRGRMYYKFARFGANPHGKEWEVSGWQANESRILNDSGINYLHQVIQGKCPVNEIHPPENMQYLPVNAVKTHKELGHVATHNKAVNALLEGSTADLFEFDMTNSGLGIAGLLFNEPKMMSAGNLYGETALHDSHAVFAHYLELTREQAKKLHTPLLHGGSLKALTKELLSTYGIVKSPTELQENIIEAYGESVVNINFIAQWGTKVVTNNHTKLNWTMPDGFKASHSAWVQGADFTVYALTDSLKNGYRALKLQADMPAVKDNSGMFTRSNAKVMGLYANIIHSVDSYVLRQVAAKGIKAIFKHDAYLVHPNNVEKLKSTLKSIYSEIYESYLLEDILTQIAKETGVEVPKLIYGNGENKVEQSNNFLQP